MNCRRIFYPSETGKSAVVEQNFFRNTREAGMPPGCHGMPRDATGMPHLKVRIIGQSFDIIGIMKKNLAYKYRIYPNAEQQVLFAKTFGCTRFVYNTLLEEKKKHYEETGKSLRNTPAHLKADYEWLKEVDSLALSNA